MDENSSTVLDDDHILWIINEHVFRSDLPAFVFIFVCMILGIFGNSVTIYVYHFRMKRISGNIYITWLALFDLISCCVSMPYELFDIRFPMIYAEPAPCKLFRTIAFVTNMCSCILLLVIAYDRYKATASPFKSQTTTHVKTSIVCSVVIAIALSSPAPFVFGVKPIPTAYPGVDGMSCSFDGSVSETIFPTIYYMVLALTFIASFIILGVVYLKIAITIYNWKHSHIGEVKENSSRKTSGTTDSEKSYSKDELKSSNRSDTSYSSLKRSINGKRDSVFTIEEEMSVSETSEKDHSCLSAIYKHFTWTKSGRAQMYSVNNNHNGSLHASKYDTDSPQDIGSSLRGIASRFRRKRKSSSKKSMKERTNVKRSNAVFVSITIVFVLSYLPFLLLEVLKQVGVIKDDLIHGPEQSIFELFTKSIYLNNVINPIIYGILNPKYRRETKNLFLGRVHKRRDSQI